MTVKQPVPQPVSKAQAAPKAPSKQEFLSIINKIQELSQAEGFGRNVGKGGSTLKDSHALVHFARQHFITNKIHVDYVPIDLEVESIGMKFIVKGTYDVHCYLRGELVFESKVFGAFDTDNSAQATHGSKTAAQTSFLFTLLQASAKSEEDLQEDRAKAQNRQPGRAAAAPISGTPY